MDQYDLQKRACWHQKIAIAQHKRRKTRRVLLLVFAIAEFEKNGWRWPPRKNQRDCEDQLYKTDVSFLSPFLIE